MDGSTSKRGAGSEPMTFRRVGDSVLGVSYLAARSLSVPDRCRRRLGIPETNEASVVAGAFAVEFGATAERWPFDDVTVLDFFHDKRGVGVHGLSLNPRFVRSRVRVAGVGRYPARVIDP
jgi:hypothetical protein